MLPLGHFLESAPQILNQANFTHTVKATQFIQALPKQAVEQVVSPVSKGWQNRNNSFLMVVQQQSPIAIVSNLTSSGSRARKVFKV